VYCLSKAKGKKKVVFKLDIYEILGLISMTFLAGMCLVTAIFGAM